MTQINQYSNSITVLKSGDYLDVDKDMGGGSYQSNKLLYSNLVSSLESDMSFPDSIVFKASDETTPLTVGDGKITIYAHTNMTITNIFGGLSVQGTTGGLTTIDIEINGVSIFTTDLLTIDFGEDTSLTATTPPNITTTSITRGDKIVLNVDTLTTGATEAGLQVVINGNRV